MKGDPEIIKHLNLALKSELTAINQYFLHARMLGDWGISKLAAKEYEESIDEMKHADELTKRILFLNGLPNLQSLDKLMIGETVEEIIACDLKLEYAAVPMLKEGIKLCEEKQDYVSRELLERILEGEEEHIDWLETQQGMIEKIGIERFILLQSEANEE